MNTLVIVLVAGVCLAAGYLFYGRWLAKTWGIDPNAKTPAVTKEDGQDYVPTNGWTVFASFHPLPELVLSQVLFRQPYLDGFLYFSGSSLAVFSLVQSPILVRCMQASRTKENPWDF